MATSHAPNRWGFGTVSAQVERLHPNREADAHCWLGNEVIFTYYKPSHKPRTFPRAASASLSRSAATLLVTTWTLSVLSIGFVGRLVANQTTPANAMITRHRYLAHASEASDLGTERRVASLFS
jgi:hypothetical protein